MKCRRVKIWTDSKGKEHRDIVWFGSYGTDFDIDLNNQAQAGKTCGIMQITQEAVEQYDVIRQIVETFHLSVPCNLLAIDLLFWQSTTIDFGSDDTLNRTFGINFTYNGLHESTMRVIASKETSIEVDKVVTYGEPFIIEISKQPTSQKGISVIVVFPYDTGADIDINSVYTYYCKSATKFYNENDKHDNYATKQNGVRDSLIQRLSILKGELWYKPSYGLPLLDKIKNKGILDSIIVNIITSHPDVYNLESFNSYIENHTYVFEFIAITTFNEKIIIKSKL